MDRGRRQKPLDQDILGILFCALGGFFAVSIVLALLEWQSSGGIGTVPVEELMRLFGPWSAFFLSAGLAVLGSVLFLRPAPLGAGRPLAALLAAALGLTFLLGAFGAGGALGAVFPGLLAGIGGRVLGALLGVVGLWIGLVLFAGAQRPMRSGSSADASAQLGITARTDLAGVSAAEASLLVNEPSPRPLPKTPAKASPPTQSPAPVRVESIRPFVPPASAPASGAGTFVAVESLRGVRGAAGAQAAARSWSAPGTAPGPAQRSAPEESASAARAALDARPAAAAARAAEAERTSPLESEPPLTPSWEHDEDDEEADEGSSAEVAAEVEEELEDEVGQSDDAEEESAPVSAPKPASWEQIGLFDEEEAIEEPPTPSAPVEAEATPSLDFNGTGESAEAENAEDPFALESPAVASATRAEAEADEEEAEEEPDQDEESAADEEPPARARRRSAVREPTHAPRLERGEDPDPAVARWNQLVFDAGCELLDQNRVAVSLLQKRFGIDFDQACKVLDELQETGLTGPYTGGRTRDILRTRDEWSAHAPQVS